MLEWDERKADVNRLKHGIAFEVAAKVFLTPHMTKRSERNGEIRFVSIGLADGRVVAVVWTERSGGARRLISARIARKAERRDYHQVLLG
jgi:uncharacterized DUF497 family protein